MKKLAKMLCLVLGATSALSAQVAVRAGAFPNVTHPQAMVGKANGWFDRALGTNAKIEWKSFNAGPAAIEAMFANAIDIAYVGPNPAINGYVRSNGEALRIIAGATSGGAALVVRGDSGINRVQDFHGKRIASPQQGNTQDISLRAWLRANGLRTRDKGGDVEILPVANADQLTLFLKKELDAAWAPEPWASRLVHEANGRIFLDERSLWPNGRFLTTELVVSTKFLQAHPEIVKQWLKAHVDLTVWINEHSAETKKLLNQQIQAETGKALSADVLNDAYGHMQVTYDPLRAPLQHAAQLAFDAGFLGRQMPDLSRLYDLTLLNQVLSEEGRAGVQ